VGRTELVDALVAAGRVRDARVAGAFRAVPREVFLPGVPVERVYADVAVPTKWDADGRPVSSSSQPAIMAEMLEQLGVEAGHRVLEVGAGTGYNAALLAHLAGPTGTVTTIDLDPDTAAAAATHLRTAGLTVTTAGLPPDPSPAGPGETGPRAAGPEAAGPEAAGQDPAGPGAVGSGGAAPVLVVAGDGAVGWPAGAPYDRVVLTAAAGDLAPAWTEQLADGGRIVLPLALRGVQQSVAFERDDAGLVSVSVVPCGFMPLRGAGSGPGGGGQPVPGAPGTFLESAAAAEPIPAPHGDPVPAGTATPQEVLGGLRLWLARHEPTAGTLTTVDRPPPVPAVLSHPGFAMTPVLPAPGALAAVVPADEGGIAVQAYGDPEPAHRLLAHVRAWQDAGRPGLAGLRIRTRPPGPPGPLAIGTPATTFLLDYLGS
jgi:protein-L-isoaspartate(D-aspartate) O-methyltransferase